VRAKSYPTPQQPAQKTPPRASPTSDPSFAPTTVHNAFAHVHATQSSFRHWALAVAKETTARNNINLL